MQVLLSLVRRTLPLRNLAMVIAMLLNRKRTNNSFQELRDALEAAALHNTWVIDSSILSVLVPIEDGVDLKDTMPTQAVSMLVVRLDSTIGSDHGNPASWYPLTLHCEFGGNQSAQFGITTDIDLPDFDSNGGSIGGAGMADTESRRLDYFHSSFEPWLQRRIQK